MWDICEVIEGRYKGKFVVISLLGLPVNRRGKTLYFKTAEKAQKHIDRTARNLNKMCSDMARSR